MNTSLIPSSTDTTTWLLHFVDALAAKATATVCDLFRDPASTWPDADDDPTADALWVAVESAGRVGAIDATRTFLGDKHRPKNPFRDALLASAYRDRFLDEWDQLLYGKYGSCGDE